jgi:hypothetical protein
MTKILPPIQRLQWRWWGGPPWSAGDPLVANRALDLRCHGTSASSFGPVSSPIPHDRAQAGKLPDIKSRGGFMMPVQKLLEIARTEVSGGSTTCVK